MRRANWDTQKEWETVDQIQDEIAHLAHKKLRMYIDRSRAIRDFSENNSLDLLPGEKEFVDAVRKIEARLEELWLAKRIALSGLESSSQASGLSPTVGSSRPRSRILSMLSK